MLRKLVYFGLLSNFAFALEEVQQSNFSATVGETIQLPCSVNTEKCGDPFIITWYRGDSVVYVFSEEKKVNFSLGDYFGRVDFLYTPHNSTVSYLRIKQLQVADEGEYTCNVFYDDNVHGCQVNQFYYVTTFMKPDSVRIFQECGAEVANGSTIAPVKENDHITLICESGNGKPIPFVSWWNGTERMDGEYKRISSGHGAGFGSSKIRFPLSRNDLGAKYECRIHGDDLEASIISFIEINTKGNISRCELTAGENYILAMVAGIIWTVIMMCVLLV